MIRKMKTSASIVKRLEILNSLAKTGLNGIIIHIPNLQTNLTLYVTFFILVPYVYGTREFLSVQ